MPLSSTQLLQPALAEVTRRFQGADGVLSYRFSADTDAGLRQQFELALLRLDASLAIDFQHQLNLSPAEVDIRPFAAATGVDPLTGQPTLNVGKTSPNASSWTLQWASSGPIPAQEILIHEWGHILGLGHPDPSNPFSTTSSSADTVMSYNRDGNAPGRYFTATDLEALTILWGSETSAPAQRPPLASGFTAATAPASLAARLQQLLDADATADVFIGGVFETLFARPAEPTALAFWSGALEAGLHRRELVDQLLLSGEVLSRLQSAPGQPL